MRRWLCVFLLLMIAKGAAAEGEMVLENESAVLPSLVAALRIEKPLYFCGEPVPLDNQEVRERLEKELLLTLWDRAQVILWLKRSGRYMPVIENILQEEGLPDDLKYMSVIESSLLPYIGSHRGAVGFWQFIKATGRRYGLVINNDKDERRNIFTSTMAATRYLSDLYRQFGSWALAAAAYNMGEERLQRAMENQEVTDYYQLYLPLETQRYLFKIIAAKMVLSNPAHYGFNIREDDLYPPLEFERATVTCSVQTPLQLVTKAASSYYKQIKDLNPEILGDYLSKGEHTIAIPKGCSTDFGPRFDELAKEWEEANRIRSYVVKPGDNLSSIADRFNVPLRSLLHWNDVNPRSYILPGRELLIYQYNN
jgi:membrane-bound lytic murein transglycosylase D